MWHKMSLIDKDKETNRVSQPFTKIKQLFEHIKILKGI